MARPVKGDVVVVPFPFSDLTQAKRRPALVLAELEGDDLILCQITSRALSDSYAISLTDADFAQAASGREAISDPTACLQPTQCNRALPRRLPCPDQALQGRGPRSLDTENLAQGHGPHAYRQPKGVSGIRPVSIRRAGEFVGLGHEGARLFQ